ILDSDKGREKLSNVPVISTFISDDANGISKNDHSTSDKSGKVIAKQKEEIEELEREIASLEDIVDDQDKEIKKLEKSKEGKAEDRKSTRLNSSHVSISYAVFCLKKKTTDQVS